MVALNGFHFVSNIVQVLHFMRKNTMHRDKKSGRCCDHCHSTMRSCRMRPRRKRIRKPPKRKNTMHRDKKSGRCCDHCHSTMRSCRMRPRRKRIRKPPKRCVR
uniref:Secreted protein n=1 Tax=Ascaris lumbricoides TaxID=6252 RepID=A0A0M3IBU4_ASCLU